MTDRQRQALDYITHTIAKNSRFMIPLTSQWYSELTTLD